MTEQTLWEHVVSITACHFREMEENSEVSFSLSGSLKTADVLMRRLLFVAPSQIHGILCHDDGAQVFYVGFECSTCKEIFLVPDVADRTEFFSAMKHPHPSQKMVPM